ncbi:MAG: ADP-forming succinate--CoA ligase subunit beta [Desulfuromonadaceae bacterium]|nr:ADP-forming succinate--CoA ligase subunit beta [Desulfuromonadaceae bacterium]
MNIHEYQAKEVLRNFGVPVPKGEACFHPAAAREAARGLGEGPYVVKAQIHAGGRGKGGGVKVVKTLDEVKKAAAGMLGMQLVTHQTGPAGKKVRRVYVEEGCRIARELYVGMLLDRVTSRVTLMASSEGGMDIEEVAAETPEKIFRETIDPTIGLSAFQARRLALKLGLGKKQLGQAVAFLQNLYRAFVDKDCSLVEINPLVVTEEGGLVALDAKLNFDDNALFRHPDIRSLRDFDEEDDNEIDASEYDLSYISLDGNIGCMVNGAGLAMATMDIIQLNGGSPANFLDVGGGASREKVTAAFKIILKDPKVKGILVNIFGGIMKCDIIAQGIIDAAHEVRLNMPLVVRLEGTNVTKGKELLKDSGLNIIAAEGMTDAARKIVEAVAAGRGNA